MKGIDGKTKHRPKLERSKPKILFIARNISDETALFLTNDGLGAILRLNPELGCFINENPTYELNPQSFTQKQELSFSNSSLGCVVAWEDPCGLSAVVSWECPCGINPASMLQPAHHTQLERMS